VIVTSSQTKQQLQRKRSNDYFRAIIWPKWPLSDTYGPHAISRIPGENSKWAELWAEIR